MSVPQSLRRIHPKSKFSPEEDAFLRNLVSQFGVDNWQRIAASMPSRNPRQCKERWFNYLCPMIQNPAWTQAEDDLLRQLVGEQGQKWVRIAKFFPSRTDINIKNRYVVLSRRAKNVISELQTPALPITEPTASAPHVKLSIPLSTEVPQLQDFVWRLPSLNLGASGSFALNLRGNLER
jgi:hypothetical protein